LVPRWQAPSFHQQSFPARPPTPPMTQTSGLLSPLVTLTRAHNLTQITTNPGADGSPLMVLPMGNGSPTLPNSIPTCSTTPPNIWQSLPSPVARPKVLTLEFDRMVSNPHFFSGRQVHLFRRRRRWHTKCLPHPHHRRRNHAPLRRPASWSTTIPLARNGDLVAQIATIDRPDELYHHPRWQNSPKSPHTNDALMSQLKLTHAEYVHFKSKDGTTVFRLPL